MAENWKVCQYKVHQGEFEEGEAMSLEAVRERVSEQTSQESPRTHRGGHHQLWRIRSRRE